MRTRLGAGPAPEQIALRLRAEPGLVCLSGDWAGSGAVVASSPVRVLADGADAFGALDDLPRVDGADPAAVGGGWFGVLGYDGRHRLAFYDNVLRLVDGVWWFEELRSAERASALDERRRCLTALLRGPDEFPAFEVGAFAGTRRSAHLAAVERAIEHIRAGDIYQVNVCARLTAPYGGDAVALFAAAARRLAPAYAAFVDCGGRAVVSLSPELFLRRRGRAVLTAPIKGTRPRVDGTTSGADELRASDKDAAENVMIVDLVRNDLGRVCATGTVAPVALLAVEPHPGVWHLVSRVGGTLRAEVDDGELLRAAFPPGSVTGAPKLRACEVVAELEAVPRGAYTGAVGFVSPCWGAEFNVAIRTFEIAGDRIELGVGGGVTADSMPSVEWQECLDKAGPLVRAVGSRIAGADAAPAPVPRSEQLEGGVFETVLVLDGVPVRLAEHLARLDRSARELYRRGVPPDLSARAAELAAAATADRSALRITCTPDGLGLDLAPAPAPPGSSAVRTGSRGASVWRHKWAERAELAAAERAAGPAAPLFVAPDGTVLETSRGNVFVLRADGSLMTAPLRDDLLPGVTRRALLDLARDAGWAVELCEFGVEEMVRGVPFWTSSLSGAVPIHAVDGRPTRRDDRAVARLARALTGGDATIR